MTIVPVPGADQAAPSVHDRKRHKNLAVLFLVLGWCALIFMITMAKLAHADEFAPGQVSKPYPNQREKHEEKIDKAAADFMVTRTAHQKAMDEADSDSGDVDLKPLPVTQGDEGQKLKFGVTDANNRLAQ